MQSSQSLHCRLIPPATLHYLMHQMFWHRRYHQRLPNQAQCQKTVQPCLPTRAATRRRRSHLDPSAQPLKREIRRHPSPKRYPKVSNMIRCGQYFSFNFATPFDPIGYVWPLDIVKNPRCMNFSIFFSKCYSATFDKIEYQKLQSQNSNPQRGNLKNLRHLWIILYKTLDCS